jgi:hypothetical protein
MKPISPHPFGFVECDTAMMPPFNEWQVIRRTSPR